MCLTNATAGDDRINDIGHGWPGFIILIINPHDSPAPVMNSYFMNEMSVFIKNK